MKRAIVLSVVLSLGACGEGLPDPEPFASEDVVGKSYLVRVDDCRECELRPATMLLGTSHCVADLMLCMSDCGSAFEIGPCARNMGNGTIEVLEEICAGPVIPTSTRTCNPYVVAHAVLVHEDGDFSGDVTFVFDAGSLKESRPKKRMTLHRF